ncbi:MAG: 6,7-dimethyl-8-ribityllumazine synthase [Candidatus Kapabacteria bacterium]|nr:6,7-dimethyl-8-ribityllumazine synthase [Candidatus Kapabacteria bacterium]
MINTIKGNFEANGKKIAIVYTRWNQFVSDKLLDGAVDCLHRYNFNDDDITVFHCPGGFEIPIVVQKIAQTKKYHAVIALGAVIRGATPHFDYIAAEVTKGLAKINLDTGIPCIYGVLTTDNIEQAIERAGGKSGNKGFEAAQTAIEMISLLESIN